MTKETMPEVPKVQLATQEWVKLEIMTINANIEKGFHEVEKNFQEVERNMEGLRSDIEKSSYAVKEEVSKAMTNMTRWMFGLMLTTAFVIVAAVLSQSF